MQRISHFAFIFQSQVGAFRAVHRQVPVQDRLRESKSQLQGLGRWTRILVLRVATLERVRPIRRHQEDRIPQGGSLGSRLLRDAGRRSSSRSGDARISTWRT